jgi:hypothetical protein
LVSARPPPVSGRTVPPIFTRSCRPSRELPCPARSPDSESGSSRVRPGVPVLDPGAPMREQGPGSEPGPFVPGQASWPESRVTSFRVWPGAAGGPASGACVSAQERTRDCPCDRGYRRDVGHGRDADGAGSGQRSGSGWGDARLPVAGWASAVPAAGEAGCRQDPGKRGAGGGWGVAAPSPPPSPARRRGLREFRLRGPTPYSNGWGHGTDSHISDRRRWTPCPHCSNARAPAEWGTG